MKNNKSRDFTTLVSFAYNLLLDHFVERPPFGLRDHCVEGPG
jgi:hypothetical protein